MEILLSHGYFLVEDQKEQNIMRPYPPLGILYISAFLEKNGFDNVVFDSTFASKPDFFNVVTSMKPRVIGLYVNLMTKLNVIEQVRYIKAHLPGATVILGGPDVRYNAANYLKAGADYVVPGEGEQTMLELVRCLKSGSEDISRIEGIAYLSEGVVRFTHERSNLKDLNTLPLPNRNKIDLSQYFSLWRLHHGKSAMSVSTMRGCPYTCKWCSRSVYGLSYRRRSPSKVADELQALQEAYNPDSIWFVDDVFTISHQWLAGFRDELKQRKIRIPYECITRADRLNEDVIEMLKDTGCFRVWIGAESGSQKIIDLMDRRVDVRQVREVIRLTRSYGIETGTFIMLGYPGETETDIEQTIRHLKEANPDHFTITVAYPIRGTELFDEVHELQTAEHDWYTSTDREIDFRRTYPGKYYSHAVRRVVNEVMYHKNINSGLIDRVMFKTKSILAKTGMRWYRLIGIFGN